MEINVAKNCNEPTGVCEVWFNPETGSFRNIDRDKAAV
jgi:replicative DNA helicase